MCKKENERKKLKKAIKNLENTMLASLGSIAEYLVRQKKTKDEASYTMELIKALAKIRIILSEEDEFIFIFQKGKNASGRISTTFKNPEKTEKVLNEIKAQKGFITSRLNKSGELGKDKEDIRKELREAFNKLEEAFTEYSENWFAQTNSISYIR